MIKRLSAALIAIAATAGLCSAAEQPVLPRFVVVASCGAISQQYAPNALATPTIDINGILCSSGVGGGGGGGGSVSQGTSPWIVAGSVYATQAGAWNTGSEGIDARAPTVTTTQYSIGDAIGPLQTVPLFRTAGGSGVLADASVLFKAGQVPPVTLYIFEANPTASTCTDNAAFGLNTADFTKLAGFKPIVISPDVPAGTTAAMGGASIALPVKNRDASPTANLYVCAVSGGTPTLAVGDFLVSLRLSQD